MAERSEGKSRRGFASMDESRQREIASKGGRAAHAKGTAHEFDSNEARAAGRKGGEAVSRNREHMAAIGRKGGEARGTSARNGAARGAAARLGGVALPVKLRAATRCAGRRARWPAAAPRIPIARRKAAPIRAARRRRDSATRTARSSSVPTSFPPIRRGPRRHAIARSAAATTPKSRSLAISTRGRSFAVPR
jgi:general stress protein YciG